MIKSKVKRGRGKTFSCGEGETVIAIIRLARNRQATKRARIRVSAYVPLYVHLSPNSGKGAFGIPEYITAEGYLHIDEDYSFFRMRS